jgi:hypothetical protein
MTHLTSVRRLRLRRLGKVPGRQLWQTGKVS